MSTTADLIRDICNAGLTQQEIARRTGIPQPRLSKWSRGAPKSTDDVVKLQVLHAEVVAAKVVKKAAKSRRAKASV